MLMRSAVDGSLGKETSEYCSFFFFCVCMCVWIIG